MNVKGPIFESKDSMKKTKADKLMYQCFESEESQNKNSKNPETKLNKSTSVSKKLKEWNKIRKEYLEHIDMLETYKQSLHNIDDALYFSKDSYTQKSDLVKVLNKIKMIDNERKIITIKELEKELKYNKTQLNLLIAKLKLLGEIFDPYVDNKKKKGQFLRLI